MADSRALVVHVLYRFAVGGLENGVVNLVNRLPAERWRLLGPMAAMNGVLMFGWSTAVIFEVLRKSLPPRAGA